MGALIDYYLFSVIAFIFILLIALYRDRKNWTFSIISIRRFKITGKFFDPVVAKAKKFWEAVSIIATIVAAFLLFDGIRTFILASQLIIERKLVGPTGGVIIPYPSPRFEIGYGYIKTPFWFFVIALPLIVIPHELLHGILLRLKGIKIKSVGLFLFLFLFGGAFVEQDKKSFEKAKLLSKVKVASVGSFANFIIFLLFFTAITLLSPTLVYVNGLNVTNVAENSPAFLAGLKEGEIILSINNQSFVGRWGGVNFTLHLLPNQKIFMRGLNKSYEFLAGIHPEDPARGYLGISFYPLTKPHQILVNLSWLAIFEYWIAVLNILPIYPLDGGVIFQSLLKAKFKRWQPVVAAVSAFFIAWLIFIILGPLAFRP